MPKTIYDCYRLNGNRAGFWVRRNIWDKDNLFFVKRIGQQITGPLATSSPHHCKPAVWGDLYRHEKILARNSRLEFPETFSWLYLGHEKGTENP